MKKTTSRRVYLEDIALIQPWIKKHGSFARFIHAATKYKGRRQQQLFYDSLPKLDRKPKLLRGCKITKCM